MDTKISKRNKSFKSRLRKFLAELGLFFILLVLPAFTLWVAFSNIQTNLLQESQEASLDEMAEMTAHMLRLSEPESFYQEAVRKLADSFKWAIKIEDIPRISSKDHLELCLFDANGKRLNWPSNEPVTKKTPSESYLSCLKRLEKDSEAQLTPKEISIAAAYSGNTMTIKTLADNPNTLINFQGIGLLKFGGWFKVSLPPNDGEAARQQGYMLAWLNIDKLEKYSLAEKAINIMERLTPPDYTFSFIDLNDVSINKSSRHKKLRNSILKLLTSNSLKSEFIYKDELFSINDTGEALRLICSKSSPKPLPILKNYTKFLMVLIPVLFLFFVWKKVFKINFNLSVKYQAILIFGFAGMTGITAMIVSTIAYQYEKQITVTQNYKSKAIEILEKVDQQYSDSYNDLIKQYKYFINALKAENSKPSEVLLPLRKAEEESIISYAVYIDKDGIQQFQAPEQINQGQSANIADKFSKVVNRVAKECLKDFNSTRSTLVDLIQSNALKAVTAKSVEGLLSNRSSFIETKLDSDEVIAFMDFPLTKDDLAKGCLLIIHEPRKLEKLYLNETGMNLSNKTGFELIAFPKKVSDQKSYYPRFSYNNEEPLWKLNDMLNQTQLPSFKEGNIFDAKYVVAAIPGSNMKNYNLFLAMPEEKVHTAPLSLSNIFMIGLAISLVILVILAILLINSIISPVKILTENALSIQKENNQQQNQIVFSDNTELESISTGLTNLVVKVNEFKAEKNSCEEVLKNHFKNKDNYVISSFLSKNICNNKTLCYISETEDNNLLMFLSRIDEADHLKASLPLTMYATALELYANQLHIHTPLNCFKNLEEYFRINLRRHLTGSVLIAFLDTKNNTFTYSGFGKIRLLRFNQQDGKCEIIDLPQGKNFVKEVKQQGNIKIDISEGDSIIALTEPFDNIKLEALRQKIENSEIFAENYQSALKKMVKELTKLEADCCNVAFIYKKQSINKSKDKKTKPLAQGQLSGSLKNV